jgi:ribonuclease HI
MKIIYVSFVIARDNYGEILKAWSKIIPTEDPLVAKASAILWAMEIAKSEGYRSIAVEGDAKICFDALNGDMNSQLWKINSLCWNAKLFSSSFIACSFCWVRREVDNVTHCMVKFCY